MPSTEKLPIKRTIRRHQLREIVPLADTTIYEMEQRGEFPRRFYLTSRSVVWDLGEVEEWLEERRKAFSRKFGYDPRIDEGDLTDADLVLKLFDEIRPEAIYDIAPVVATGRSDFPNQINNVLCFPGIFRGALDAGATTITEGMKLAAANAIASAVPADELAADFIIPSVFDRTVGPLVAAAVADAARRDGVVRG